MSDSMQQSNRQVSDEANRLESLGQFAQATELYKQVYDSYPGSFVTSHYIKCLRKQGKANEAVKFGRQLSRQLQDDLYVHKELSWAIYDVYLKKSEDVGGIEHDDGEHERQGGQDFQKMQEVARYILSKASSTDDILRTRTVFAICNEAKQRENWQVMYDFAVQLDPERLSKEQRDWNGQKLSPDYQNWLYKMVRSLFELKRYEECMNFAQKGIEQYPREKLFPWWKASAKKALGQVEEAIHELEQIDMRFPKEWYIQRDIAGGYIELQKYEVAKVWFCKAASCPGDIKHRYKMFEQMYMLFELLESWGEAYDHLQLACAISEREGWERSATSLRGQLLQFSKRHAEHLTFPANTLMEEWPGLYRRCQITWREMVSASRMFGKGQIVKLNEERKFGFIKRHHDESGKDVFFPFRSLAKGFYPGVGMEVEFEIEKSFDPGKNQESLTAVNVRLGSAEGGGVVTERGN